MERILTQIELYLAVQPVFHWEYLVPFTSLIDIIILFLVDRSLSVACVGCVTLGSLAAFAKKFDVKGMSEKSEILEKFNEPFGRKDEKWED